METSMAKHDEYIIEPRDNGGWAAGLDPAKATDEQAFEDLRYCAEYPNDSLQKPNGQHVRCRDLIAAIQVQGARCATGPDSKSEACKNVMAWFATLNIGRR
jgi:hypothetical protein